MKPAPWTYPLLAALAALAVGAVWARLHAAILAGERADVPLLRSAPFSVTGGERVTWSLDALAWNPERGRAYVMFDTGDALPPGVLSTRVDLRARGAAGQAIDPWRDGAEPFCTMHVRPDADFPTSGFSLAVLDLRDVASLEVELELTEVDPPRPGIRGELLLDGLGDGMIRERYSVGRAMVGLAATAGIAVLVALALVLRTRGRRQRI